LYLIINQYSWESAT